VDELIVIEVLDRQGRTIARHAARLLPLRIGTEFRVRAASHPVGGELAECGLRSLREPLIALAAVLALVAALVLDAWSGTDERIRVAKLAATPLLALVALLAWSGSWALAGRLLTGERRMCAHLAVASLALLGAIAANRLDYLAFALSASYADFAAAGALWAALGLGLWRHLALAMHRPGRGAAFAAAGVAAACVGMITLAGQLARPDETLEMAYMKSIKLPEARLVDGTGTRQFFRDAKQIEGELEALRNR
jgi:hypothetical protein